MRTSTDTGFVVFPVPDGRFDQRLNALNNFTTLAKYDWKLVRQIGIAVAHDHHMVEIDWAYFEGPWQYDPNLEEGLRTRYPFRQTPPPKAVFRYPGR